MPTDFALPDANKTVAITDSAVLTTDSERSWATAAHLAGLVGFVGIPPLIGSLVVWLMKKDSSSFVDAHGKEAINFNISIMLYGIVSALLLFAIIGIALIPIVAFSWLILTIVAGLSAGRGEIYRYPLTIRFIS